MYTVGSVSFVFMIAIAASGCVRRSRTEPDGQSWLLINGMA